jgi:hypothetical protein
MNYLTKRLHYLLKTYLTLTPENWIKYESFIFPILMTPKHLGVINLDYVDMEKRKPEDIKRYVSEELEYIDHVLEKKTYFMEE